MPTKLYTASNVACSQTHPAYDAHAVTCCMLSVVTILLRTCAGMQLATPLVQCRNGSGGLSQQGMRQGSGNGPRGALGPAQAYTRGFVPRKRYVSVLYVVPEWHKGWGSQGGGHRVGSCRLASGGGAHWVRANALLDVPTSFTHCCCPHYSYYPFHPSQHNKCCHFHLLSPVSVTVSITVSVTVRSNMAPAKPLSADEIVKANAKKRANGAQMGGPVKVGRLDAATMAALGRRGPGSGLGQLLAQSTGPSSGEGGGQPTGQAAAQHAGAPLCCSCLTVPV